MIPDEKKWYESKLVWTGVAMLIVGAVDMYKGGFDTESLALVLSGALVPILRAVTEKKITL